jgi:heptosyltransferase I
MPEPRFLVVRLGSLGDIVHTFPAVAGLRNSFPNSDIIWLTHPRWKSLVGSSGLATEIWDIETRSLSSLRRVIRQIRATQFAAAIDYQGLWKSAALPFLGKVGRRIGFSSATIREFGVPVLYTDPVRCFTTHIADQNGELSLRAGARNGVAAVTLRVLPLDEQTVRDYLLPIRLDRYIVLSPGGGWRSKCWPAERFGELCRKIYQHFGIRCIVNYGPGEEHLAAAVRHSSGDAYPFLYHGELGPLMALLNTALCFVGSDTGPLHLAVALGTPAVALFGPTDPARNGPYRCSGRVAAASEENIILRAPNIVATHRRADQTHPSMLQIQVDTVLEALRCRIGGRA